ncbi:monovalent cation/H(+) antiporter subunit G [Kocuria turfanensis]|uniref:monovalent cation/H(+) antiporter subunit G n=1 Tax=Kocuria turfanensis TaxID=388357 RepID=UPI000AD0A2BB|nr:monovalent cation/H(+) antiporter subunit G [Kocuria turfanensis]
MLDTVLDAAAAVCLVLGALMSLAAAIGLVRFPDLLTRMHAGTKPQVFGLLLMLTAVALENRDPVMIPLIILGWVFQLLTVPVSAHMVGRSTYRTKHLNRATLTQDDLQEVLNRAGERGGGEPAAAEPAPAEPALSDAALSDSILTEPPNADGQRADGQQTDGSGRTR